MARHDQEEMSRVEAVTHFRLLVSSDGMEMKDGRAAVEQFEFVGLELDRVQERLMR